MVKRVLRECRLLRYRGREQERRELGSPGRSNSCWICQIATPVNDEILFDPPAVAIGPTLVPRPRGRPGNEARTDRTFILLRTTAG